MRLFANADFKFLQQRRKTFTISAILFAVCLAWMIGAQVTGRSWVNYGVDFTGGTLVQILFQEPTSVAELRSTLSGFQADVTRFGAENEYLVRVPEFSEGGTEVGDLISSTVSDAYGADAFEVVRTEAVGPKIGNELQARALLAILLSFALTLIYLAFRFEWRYGIAAIIALVHDIVLSLGVISILRLEVSLSTVAAILTIIGYSLNDTIVIFDRIRETVGKTGRRGAAYIDLLNRGINETMPRTVMTSATTLAALFALFLFGGEVIRDFALILIIGVILGTYSSVFVASPALLVIDERSASGGSGTGKAPGRARAAAEV